jgi:hypothetical protein
VESHDLDADIVLTADSTLMSDYHRNEFLGFGTCAPPNFIPDQIFKWLFFPPIKTEKDVPAAAPYGLRKVEAQLLGEGFKVQTVPPNHLKRHVAQARVLGIHVMDPFGLGPASSTLAFILNKEPFLAQCFRALLGQPEVRKAKKRGLRIIVGGPGVWQFQYRPRFAERYGVDCIVSGEAENVAGKIFKAAVEGQPLPRYYETSIEETPKLDEIPDIVNPSVNGLVEIGRGCCRGCQFCSVTLRPLRWYPIEKIRREIDVNIKVGGFVDPLKPEGQVALSRNLQIATGALDSTGLCLFVAFCVLDKPEALDAIVAMISALRGQKFPVIVIISGA